MWLCHRHKPLEHSIYSGGRQNWHGRQEEDAEEVDEQQQEPCWRGQGWEVALRQPVQRATLSQLAQARARAHSLHTLATPSLLEVMIWDGFPGLAAML